jgi:hypothetical protein
MYQKYYLKQLCFIKVSDPISLKNQTKIPNLKPNPIGDKLFNFNRELHGWINMLDKNRKIYMKGKQK